MKILLVFLILGRLTVKVVYVPWLFCVWFKFCLNTIVTFALSEEFYIQKFVIFVLTMWYSAVTCELLRELFKNEPELSFVPKNSDRFKVLMNSLLVYIDLDNRNNPLLVKCLFLNSSFYALKPKRFLGNLWKVFQK